MLPFAPRQNVLSRSERRLLLSPFAPRKDVLSRSERRRSQHGLDAQFLNEEPRANGTTGLHPEVPCALSARRGAGTLRDKDRPARGAAIMVFPISDDD